MEVYNYNNNVNAFCKIKEFRDNHRLENIIGYMTFTALFNLRVHINVLSGYNEFKKKRFTITSSN